MMVITRMMPVTLVTSPVVLLLGALGFRLCLVASSSAPPLCVVESTSGAVKAPAVANCAQEEKEHKDVYVRVFPLLSKQVSDGLISSAEAAAMTRGWHKDHEKGEYGTTDLEVRKVPELWKLVEPHLQNLTIGAKSALANAGIRGIEDLDFHDIFLVRYSADGQRSLGPHEDGSLVTFQVALNQEGLDFDDGGTFFDALGCRLQPRVGEAHAFPGHLRHQGLEITRGKRYVLVGFSRNSGTNREEDKNVGLSFGSAYNVVVDVPFTDNPCLGPRSHGTPFVAKVNWWGCADDTFDVRSRLQSNTGHVRWIWVDRHPVHTCSRHESQHRKLRLLHHELMNHSDKELSFLLALPPGHQYNALQLDPCPVFP